MRLMQRCVLPSATAGVGDTWQGLRTPGVPHGRGRCGAMPAPPADGGMAQGRSWSHDVGHPARLAAPDSRAHASRHPAKSPDNACSGSYRSLAGARLVWPAHECVLRHGHVGPYRWCHRTSRWQCQLRGHALNRRVAGGCVPGLSAADAAAAGATAGRRQKQAVVAKHALSCCSQRDGSDAEQRRIGNQVYARLRDQPTRAALPPGRGIP